MLSRQKALAEIAALTEQYNENPGKIKEYIWGMCEIQERLKDPYFPTYYELLGIRFQATEEDIKHAYKKMCLHIHPDKNPNDNERATRYFQLISNVYETLSVAQARAIYDEACLKANKSQESTATKEHKTEYTVSISSVPASSVQEGALVPTVQRTLYTLFEEAHFFDENGYGVIGLCQKSLAIALAAFKEKSIRAKLSHYVWEEIGLMHIEIARELCLLEPDDTLYILKGYNFRIFQKLAKQHAEICLMLLRIPAFDQRWDNEMLTAFLSQHANSPFFSEIKEAIDTNSVLKSKMTQGVQNKDKLTEEEAISFVIKHRAQIIEAIEKYFHLLWPHRKKLIQHIKLYDWLGTVEKTTAIVDVVKRDISVDDLVSMSSDQRMICVRFDPLPIAKLILTNADILTADFSGSEIEKLKKALGDDTESINTLIMDNPVLRARYEAWVQFTRLLNTQDALPEQKIEACIREGKLSSADIFGCFLSLLQASPTSVDRFFDNEKLKKYVADTAWISLASLFPVVCLKLLRSPLAEKVSAADLNRWIKSYGADVFLCIETNPKLQQMMRGYTVLHQPGVMPQRSASLVPEKEVKDSQENVTLRFLRQLRIIHADRIRSWEPLYTCIEEQVANDPDSHQVTEQQRQNFIRLIFEIITNPEDYKKINIAMIMPRSNLDQKQDLIKLKQELITHVKSLFLKELHFTAEDAKPENRINQVKKTFHVLLGEFFFKSQEFLDATAHFKAMDNLAEQSPQVQFYARVCFAVAEALTFDQSPQADITTLGTIKTRLSAILDDPLAQDFSTQMVSVRKAIKDLNETVPALCLRLKSESEDEAGKAGLEYIALVKARGFYRDALSMRNWIQGATPLFLERSLSLLTAILHKNSYKQVKAYLLDIYWIRGDFKKAYDLGVAILPVDKITNEAKEDTKKDAEEDVVMDSVDSTMMSKIANRLGFCLLQPELQEQYQKDKTIAEHYFKYAAHTATPDSAETALAAIGEAACLAKEEKLTQEQAMQVFKNVQEKATSHCQKDLFHLSYYIVACSQVINLLPVQGKDVSSEVQHLTRLIPRFSPYQALPVPKVLLNEEVLTVFKQYAQQSLQNNSTFAPPANSRAMVPVSTNPTKVMTPALN